MKTGRNLNTYGESLTRLYKAITDHFRVRIHGGDFNIENIKEYDITDKFKEIWKTIKI